MSNFNDLISKRKNHLANCIQYLQTKLQHECPDQLYDLVQDRIGLVNDHFRRIDDVSGLIETMSRLVGKPALVSNFRASFYNQIFWRMQEIEAIIRVLNNVWSSYIAFDNFSKRFSHLCLIFSKFCEEISSPLGSHFTMILPGNDFAYLRFPNVARHLFRVFVPTSASEDPHVWPIMAHEIGHAFSFLSAVEERIEAECGPLISQRLRSIQERTQRSREEFADVEYVLSRSWYQWVAEICADLFALRRVGPCFIDSQVLELMAFDPFSLNMERSGHLFVSSHPPPDLRIRMLIRCSNQWFSQMATHASACQKIWDEMLSNRSSPTLDERRELFDLLCDHEVLQPLEQTIANMFNQLVPIKNLSLSSLEAIMTTRPINVTDALSSLVCEGRTDGPFVEELAKKIKLAT